MECQRTSYDIFCPVEAEDIAKFLGESVSSLDAVNCTAPTLGTCLALRVIVVSSVVARPRSSTIMESSSF